MRKRDQFIRLCTLLVTVLTLTAMAGCSDSPTTEPGGSGSESRDTNDSGSGGSGY
jgi:hypothetical protein